ncbi:MAG: hypothetical protein JXX28_16040 [Deltaproteobacteria bacterium]|nr:hypothetical protein [Deltaproteobacteria bacterium]
MKKLLALTFLSLAACPKEEVDDTSPVEDTSVSEPTCEEQVFSGTYQVLASDDHLKHAFTVLEGTATVRAELVWEDPAWGFDLDLGTGTCPHSGTTWLHVEGAGSPVVGEVIAADYEDGLATGPWFAHIALQPGDHAVGDTAEYTLTVSLCPEA